MLNVKSRRMVYSHKKLTIPINKKEAPQKILGIIIELMVFSYAITSSLFSSAFPEISYILTRLLVVLRLMLIVDAGFIIGHKGVKKADSLFLFAFPFVFFTSYYVCRTWELFDALFIALYLSKTLKYDQVIKMFLRPLIIALGFILVSYVRKKVQIP